ncbi:DUF533 domain-containing protein [Tropicibacter naphthalenivorans]|uniref:Inner membrane protein YebE n=1 Tax=Tropicibacter naphthalenivorans TaxID=441103 RepID=A0A0P1G4U8_9RHOB|nr:DUF533 domain-containing protein [Tropicibacter naphthalenivorans]CUH76826.1 hypothetical protein TRN7648_01145 [Tropicibacter naphthalenivorans]SMC62710.1 Uncharacterized membrane protein YebE, DUF533 family [Tropicibacter naphthalenivorans]
MGLMGTLAKVAIGYAAARGVDKLAQGQGLGGLFPGKQVAASDPNAAAQGQMLKGEMPQAAQAPLGGMMDMFKQNGFGQMSGGLAGGLPGGLGDQVSGMMDKLKENPAMAGLMGAMSGAAVAQGQGVGALLDAFNTESTAPEAEEAAGLMLRAMIQAAKCDGVIDESEKAKILEAVGEDADPGDMNFVQEQLAAPVDPEALAADTPEAQRVQVYSASLMTISVDNDAIAQYLDRLAKALELDEMTVNTLHAQMGMQPLYS